MVCGELFLPSEGSKYKPFFCPVDLTGQQCLDTNICIFAINRRPQKTLEIIQERSKDGIYISSLTIAELEYGVAYSDFPENNRISLSKFLSVFNIVDFDDADAVEYGKLKANLRRQGKLFGPIDMLLAAQAISKKFIFVTNNTNEFKNVDGLLLEDWKNT